MCKINEILFVCTIALLPSTNTLPQYNTHCKIDSDCNNPNFYCYEARECVQCTNCSNYNRQPSPITKCAKDKHQCGICVSGTEAVFNNDETFSCQSINSPISTNHSNFDEIPIITDEKNIISIILIVVLCLVVVICITLLIKYKIWVVFKDIWPLNYRSCPTVNSVNSDNNNIPKNPPPPYSERNPTAPPEENPLIAQPTRFLNDDNQCANPFHNPNYVKGGTYLDDPPILADNPESPVIIDENTQPSDWSPIPSNPQNPSNLNALNNQPTDFSTALSAINLSEHENNEQPTNQDNTNPENTEPENRDNGNNSSFNSNSQNISINLSANNIICINNSH